MDTPGESNTLAAAALFAASVVVDAFTARDAPEPEGTAATSLRASSIVLVACLASPPIREWMLLEQRAVGAVLLAGVAFAGMHEGSTGQRVGDSIFIVLMYVAMLYMFWSGGVVRDVDGKRINAVSPDAPPFVRRPVSVLAPLTGTGSGTGASTGTGTGTGTGTPSGAAQCLCSARRQH